MYLLRYIAWWLGLLYPRVDTQKYLVYYTRKNCGQQISNQENDLVHTSILPSQTYEIDRNIFLLSWDITRHNNKVLSPNFFSLIYNEVSLSIFLFYKLWMVIYSLIYILNINIICILNYKNLQSPPQLYQK